MITIIIVMSSLPMMVVVSIVKAVKARFYRDIEEMPGLH